MIDIALLLERLRIPSTKRGAYLVARCPSPEHDDRNPSWAIRVEPSSTRHGQHRCLACGFWGGPLSLAAAVLGTGEEAAMAFLRDVELSGPGLPLRVEVVARPGPFGGECALPEGVYFEPLELWPEPARDYLNDRHVTDFQVRRWGLGYAVEGELAGRVVFVLRDEGRVVGWQARSWKKGAKPKYKNPRRTDPGIHPGAIFGSEHWPATPRDRLIVVEGPFDGLAVEMMAPARDNDEVYFACLRGSDLHPDQVRRLSGWRELVVVTDPDEAGDKAAALISGLGRWCIIRRVRLPEGEDCSSLASRGDFGSHKHRQGLSLLSDAIDGLQVHEPSSAPA